MGAKNCPETPRQRMIGMMYLVLTAMLALNVSADVLNAFTKVQMGLSSTITNVRKKNAETYNDIEMAYSLNKTKVEEVRNKALAVKKSTDELVDFVEKLKYDLVVHVDGEDANINDIKAKDNLDASGQIMILQGQGKVLRKKIDVFRDELLAKIPEKDTLLRGRLMRNLNTEDPKPVDGEFMSWESNNFENIPLAGVVTMLSLIQADVLNSEADIVRYLQSSIDAESYKFNKLAALVIPDSRYILRGEKFKARIILAAMDTTQRSQILVEGRDVAYEGDFGVYTEVASRLGVRKLKGVINYLSPSGEILPKTFETEYEVADPAVVISPTKMNVFYVGVDNPVSLAAPGLSTEGIVPEITNGKITKVSGDSYIVRPGVPGKKCEITVKAKIGGQLKALQTQEFRVKEVPDPVAKVGGAKGGPIKKNVLIANGGVDVEMENFDFDMKFKVQSFSIYTVVDGYVQEAASSTASFSEEQIKMIKNLKRNQMLAIENIVVKGPDGSTRKLPYITFKID